ncbi:hypothetical protein SteCoe_14324 [Stentor coeruleus]|uniref:Transcription initiation factor TFIID subunit 2 n=1 Tax=Stentor coeruleus TaxID=5963 RepID=A0A1R2C678_9CILI|nr:hypothetical protein SteCoe_14324 [Stentor coeruleus]
MINLLKQETCLSIDFENNCLSGKTRIKHILQDSNRLSLYCKQLEITKVYGSQGQIPHSYPPPENQSKWLSYALNNTHETKDLLEMSWQLWDYELQQGGFLSLTFPFSRGEVTIYIEYQIHNPIGGLKMYSHNGSSILITESAHESKRYWMPCLDGLHHKYPLTLEIQVPEEYYVVASGELIGVVNENSQRFFQYSTNTYISTIGFCVAKLPYILQDPNNSLATHFSMKSDKELLYTIHNSKFSYGNMLRSFAGKFAKPFPFLSQKVVFLPSVGDTQRHAGLSILDEKYLINERLHEGIIPLIRELVSSASYNWLECFYRMFSWADYWLIYGLQEYLAWSYIGEILDHNELKFIINREVKNYCSYVEKGLELRPLCSMFFTNPNDLLMDPVFRLKSGLVFHMISSKVGKLHLQKVLEVFLCPQSTTNEFIKSFKKQYRISLKEFAKNWIYGTGAPLLQCKFSYNKRDNTLDFSLDQTPLFQSYLDSSANKQFSSLGNTNYSVPLRMNMMRFYTGPLSIIIYETDGSEIESFKKDIEVNKEHFKTQIQCKKKLKKPNNPKRREETEEEKFNRQNECPVLWVRVDPDFEILRKVEIAYNDFMWMEQLKKEKEDVLAQHDAIIAARKSTDYTNVLNLLYEKLEDNKCFYKVRMKAAKSLSAISYPINAYKGLDYLIYYFKNRHYDKKFLKPNDFSSRDEYFVDKTVLRSIIKVSDMSLTYNYSRIRVNSSFVVEFLADVLKSNDNSNNSYDDSYWRGNLLEILGNTTNPVYISEIFQEMIWNFKIDTTIPSHNYVITSSCLKGLLKISHHHKLSLQTTYNHFNTKLAYYPPRIQQKILMFMISYQYIQHEQPGEFLKIPLNMIAKYPQNGHFYVKCLWKVLKKFGSSDWVLHEIRANEIIKKQLWDLCTSPYSLANPYYSFTITSLYKYLFPRDWSTDTMDPAWEEKQDIDPSQHRFEAIDLTKGTWREWAEEVLSRMMNHEYSGPFLIPVDYEAEGLYDYPEIITHPMDFSTVQGKLHENEYSNFHDLVADVRLIFDNCRLYNAEGCTLYKHAEMLDSLFRDLVAPIEEHLGISQPEVRLKLRVFAGDIQIENGNN